MEELPILTEPVEYDWFLFTLASAAYLVGLLGTAFDPPHQITVHVIRPLFSIFWVPIASILSMLLVCFCWIFPAIPGSIAFNCWGTKFLRARLCVSSGLLAVTYAFGNPLHFRAEQWYWLHTYMCGYLATAGSTIPKLQRSNWAVFIMLVIAVTFRFHVPEWRLLDYVWSTYFLFVSGALWTLPIKRGDTC